MSAQDDLRNLELLIEGQLLVGAGYGDLVGEDGLPIVTERTNEEVEAALNESPAQRSARVNGPDEDVRQPDTTGAYPRYEPSERGETGLLSGEIPLRLSQAAIRELARQAVLDGQDPANVVREALRQLRIEQIRQRHR